jgi:hypothetical protein
MPKRWCVWGVRQGCDLLGFTLQVEEEGAVGGVWEGLRSCGGREGEVVRDWDGGGVG